MEKALSAFEEASRLEPRNLDYLWALTEYYEKFSQVDDILRVVNRILELDPYNEDAKAKMALFEKAAEEEPPKADEPGVDEDGQVKMDL